MRSPWPGLPVLLLLASLAGAQDLTLEYSSRYDKQPGPDHLIDVIAVDSRRALVGSNLGAALIDVTTLPPGGSPATLARLTDLHVRNFYQKDAEYVYANLFGGECDMGVCGPGGSPGFAILKLEPNDVLRLVGTRQNPDEFWEKMAIVGDLLYVTAHASGLRIYDLTNPEIPLQVGSLQAGFVDAWAIAVDGDRAYVADGSAGLKIVDVSDPTMPVLVDGETLATAKGSAQDVTVRDGRVYVALGGPGVGVYLQDDLASRRIRKVGSFAKDLDWVGDHLAVATYDGLRVLAPGPGTELTLLAEEIAQRRGANAALRLCSAVAAGPNDTVLAANWDYMDVYELKDASLGTQPDINASLQRIRFHPNGGAQDVTLTNNGEGTLDITDVTSSGTAFTVNYSGGLLAPGDSATMTVTYAGGSTTDGTAVVQVLSNDPDESPLTIRVFGNTTQLDPGDPAPDFTLPTIAKDVNGDLTNGSFTLSSHLGRVVWFTIFSSW